MTLVALIHSFGYIGIFAILFAETGFLVGVVLPGDTLLFTAGFLASAGYLNIYILIIGAFIASVLGDSLGYYIGKKIGPKIFTREDSLFFKHAYVERTQKFFERHGKKTIFLARYIPIVRTFAPLLAGVGQMRYRSFLVYNIAGGAAWALVLSLVGYFLGTRVPNIEKYILPIVIGIFVLSFIPVIIELVRNTRKGKQTHVEKKA